jgi:tRNA A37 threonylcarbamoyladenosine modification protein TsaB
MSFYLFKKINVTAIPVSSLHILAQALMHSRVPTNHTAKTDSRTTNLYWDYNALILFFEGDPTA